MLEWAFVGLAESVGAEDTVGLEDGFVDGDRDGSYVNLVGRSDGVSDFALLGHSDEAKEGLIEGVSNGDFVGCNEVGG